MGIIRPQIGVYLVVLVFGECWSRVPLLSDRKVPAVCFPASPAYHIDNKSQYLSYCELHLSSDKQSNILQNKITAISSKLMFKFTNRCHMHISVHLTSTSLLEIGLCSYTWSHASQYSRFDKKILQWWVRQELLTLSEHLILQSLHEWCLCFLLSLVQRPSFVIIFSLYYNTVLSIKQLADHTFTRATKQQTRLHLTQRMELSWEQVMSWTYH